MEKNNHAEIQDTDIEESIQFDERAATENEATENGQDDLQIETRESKLERELSEMKDQWLRAVAETENIRKRGQREKEDAMRYGPVSLARDIIGVADNLRRALDAHGKENGSAEASAVDGLMTGLELIVKELDTIFDRHNIKRVHPLHEKFDPNLHQAMFEIENNDHPAGTVLNVMQDGYTLHDRLLRAAMVGVSKVSIATSPEQAAHVDQTA